MNKSALIRNAGITSDKYIIRYSLAEDLNFKYVRDDLFCFSVDVGVHQCYVVIACYHVSEGGQTLFDALDRYGVR